MPLCHLCLFFFVTTTLSAGELPLDRPIECTAKVTNRIFKVTIDPATRALSATTDNGYIYQGTANYFYSPRAKSDLYYLTTSFTSGIELELERGGQQRIALCLKETECYLCRQ